MTENLPPSRATQRLPHLIDAQNDRTPIFTPHGYPSSENTRLDCIKSPSPISKEVVASGDFVSDIMDASPDIHKRHDPLSA